MLTSKRRSTLASCSSNRLNLRNLCVIVLLIALTAHHLPRMTSFTSSYLTTFQNVVKFQGQSEYQVGRQQQQQQQESSPNNSKEAEDTAIIITTSWIPTHPSTAMIDTVTDSIDEYLIGLSPTAPIFIMVDHFKPPTPKELKDRIAKNHTEELAKEEMKKHEQLDGFVFSLYSKYLMTTTSTTSSSCSSTRINNHRRRPTHIVTSVDHWHIGGNVFKALHLIEEHYPRVQFLYYVQHDFAFIRPVYHTALVNIIKNTTTAALGTSSQASSSAAVNYIRFRHAKSKVGPTCPAGVPVANLTIAEHNDVRVYKSALYSDNNHLVRLSWYKEMVIGKLGKNIKRPPEFPMMYQVSRNCHLYGIYTYAGKQNHHDADGQEELDNETAVVLEHLDGRTTTNFTQVEK